MASILNALAIAVQLSFPALLVFVILNISTPAFAGATHEPLKPHETQMNLVTGPIPEAQLEAYERKFLQKVYSQDPVDKRLQRLELLVFGATQDGSEAQRWEQLQKSLAKVGGDSAKMRAKQHQKSSSDASKINQIEEEVFKKTFPREFNAKRLDRLEVKLFGQSSPNMATEQRINRLTRATGLAQDPGQTALTPFLGRLRPNTGNGMGGLPFSQHFNDGGLPELGPNDPQMAEIIREMQRKMRSYEQFGLSPNDKSMPGLPGNGQFNFRFYYQTPNGKEYYYESPSRPRPLTPGRPQPRQKPSIPGLTVPNTDEIPPYGDPNMI